MSALEQALADYLQLRHSLGHELAEAGWLLPGFVAYLDAHSSPTVTIERGPGDPPDALQIINATYMTYTRIMSENAMPLPYEVQEMTTTEARKHLPELVNMAAYGHVTTVLTRDGRRLARIVPEEDAWVYSPAWQEKLREADTDLAVGRVRRFGDDDDFLAHLEALDDEAGG